MERMSMKKPLIAFAALAGMAWHAWPQAAMGEEGKANSVNQRIIEILIENKVISKEQYEELKTLAQAEEKQKKAGEQKAVAGYDKGFFIESADKESKVRFDGRFHGDFKAYLGDHPEDSSFFVRRARLCASGTLAKYYDFRVEYEAGKGSSARLNDGFLNVHYWPEAQLSFGQFKVPFSMEELESDNWINFIERSLANRLAPSRDVGVMVHGGLWKDLLYYQVGVFNGYKMNQASDIDTGKDGALRLVVSPFLGSETAAVKGLRIGGALTYGNQELPALSDWWNNGELRTAADTTYLSLDGNVDHDGRRTRSMLELYWDWGSTVLKGEYVNVALDGLQLKGMENDFDIRGGYVSLSHYLTGEKFTFKKGIPGRTVPLKNFALGEAGWGAWQIGARYEFVRADEDMLRLGYVDSSLYTDKADGVTLGVNWYPNEMFRFMLNYTHIEFDDEIRVRTAGGRTGRIDEEDLILSRLQAVF